MLPILKAQAYLGILEGGSTRPWKVIVRSEYGITPFVVKLYKTKDINESYSVAKDVYCSILAKSFGLETPMPALIEFTDDFINNLPSDEIRNELHKKDSRLKFGCKLIDGAYPYIDNLHRTSLLKYDIENIYAFDNLIKNVDRKIADGKSNILLKDTKAYLIDHELTLAVNKKTIEDFNKNVWVYWKANHIFYSFLKAAHKDTKNHYFESFEKMLNTLDFNTLDGYNEQLNSIGHHTLEHYLVIKDYLCHVKQFSKKFVEIIRNELE